MKKKHKELVQEGVNKLLEAAILADKPVFSVNTVTRWFINGISGRGTICVKFEYTDQPFVSNNSKSVEGKA
jgi:hypothetical protein